MTDTDDNLNATGLNESFSMTVLLLYQKLEGALSP